MSGTAGPASLWDGSSRRRAKGRGICTNMSYVMSKIMTRWHKKPLKRNISRHGTVGL